MKAVTVFLALAVVSAAGFRGRRQSGYRFPPQGFRSSPDSEEEVERNTLAPSLLHRQNIQYRAQEGPRPRPQEYQQGKRPLLSKNQSLKEEELEEEEKEEPDRLTLLLPQSKFNCQGKGTGYYADEGLSCEVFHYCQDNARHSWICPEGFLFHQVHLICMPPSSDNICTQSSQYHFVNEYLYKPINAEEAERKPNVTLRYSERYYPETFYREEDVNRPHEAQQEVVHQGRPVLRQPNQVFHSPEEVNIPLQHRRPQHPPQRGYSPQSSAEYEY